MFNRREFLRNTTAAAATIPTAALFGSQVLITGCNGTSIAQDIVNWTPALESTAATAAATTSILLPVDAILISAALVAFDAGANLVTAEAKAYLANPGQTTLQALQTAVITFQQQISTSLLSAAKIVDPKSQAVITAAINGVATVITSILALITQIKGNTVAAVATKTAKLIKLREVNFTPNIQLVAVHYKIPETVAEGLIFTTQIRIQQEGF